MNGINVLNVIFPYFLFQNIQENLSLINYNSEYIDDIFMPYSWKTVAAKKLQLATEIMQRIHEKLNILKSKKRHLLFVNVTCCFDMGCSSDTWLPVIVQKLKHHGSKAIGVSLYYCTVASLCIIGWSSEEQNDEWCDEGYSGSFY